MILIVIRYMLFRVWVDNLRRDEEEDHSRCLQHNPEKTGYRCSPESRRTSGGWHNGVRIRLTENPLNYLLGLLHLECSTYMHYIYPTS